MQFILTAAFRLFLLTSLKTKLKNRIIGYSTLLIGSGRNAAKLYQELENEKYSQGYVFKGFVNTGGETDTALSEKLTSLGNIKNYSEVNQGE